MPGSEVAAPTSKARFSAPQLVAVCALFLLAGTTTTLSTKWADSLDAPDRFGVVTSFEHPFFQTLIMFMGESICFAVFRWTRWRKGPRGAPLVLGDDASTLSSPLLLAVPAVLDLGATTLNNFAVSLTTASVYQMLKGSTVVFTALFSYLFLQRRFFRHEYLGMFVVTSGLVTVGVSSALRPSSAAASNPVLGNVLVVVAQAVQSAQFVLEEGMIHKYQIPPLFLVGCEGLFGVSMVVTLLALFQAWPSASIPDNAVIALEQMANCPRCLAAVLCLLAAMPVANGTAVTITKEMSAATRMVVDALRNISVWGFTMAYTSYFHEEFSVLQLVGFALIVLGGALYREFLRIPLRFFSHEPSLLGHNETSGNGSGAATSALQSYTVLEPIEMHDGRDDQVVGGGGGSGDHSLSPNSVSVAALNANLAESM